MYLGGSPMTLRILSDSETGRISYPKEVDEFLENGLTAANAPQGTAAPQKVRALAGDHPEPQEPQ